MVTSNTGVVDIIVLDVDRVDRVEGERGADGGGGV